MPRTRPVHFMLLLILALVWGSSFILMKRAMYGTGGVTLLSPVQVAALRMAFAGIALLPFVPTALRKTRPADWKWLFVVGICGSGAPAFLFTFAQQHIESSLAGMLNALTPLFTLLIGLAAFGAHATSRQVAGVLIGLAGAASLLWMTGITGPERLVWPLLVVLATLCYGISVNTIQFRLSHLSGLQTAALSMLIVGIPGAVIAATTGAAGVAAVHADGLQALAATFTLGVVGSALANALFFRLTQSTSALFSSSVTYLIPLVAVGWGVYDGEPITWRHLVAGLVILAGVWLIRRRR